MTTGDRTHLREQLNSRINFDRPTLNVAGPAGKYYALSAVLLPGVRTILPTHLLLLQTYGCDVPK